MGDPPPPAVVPNVIVNCDVLPPVIVSGENIFETVAPLTTFKESDAAAPVPALAVVTGPVLLT